MLKRIRQHYHASFGGEVSKAMDVAVARVADATSSPNDINSDSIGSKEMEQQPAARQDPLYASEGREYEPLSEVTTVPMAGMEYNSDDHAVSDIQDLDDSTPYAGFLPQDTFFDGSHMNFVDYFNASWGNY